MTTPLMYSLRSPRMCQRIAEQAVKRPEVKVLPAMKTQASLVRRHAAKETEVDVGVVARDVDVSVMDDGVLPGQI